MNGNEGDAARATSRHTGYLQTLAVESRLIVSEPLGALAGAWNEGAGLHRGDDPEGR